MDAFRMCVADLTVEVLPLFGSTRVYCREYLAEREPDAVVTVHDADLKREQELLDLEAVEEGLKKRRFSGPFLERAVIQRRVAEALRERGVLMMHGSTVAVDGYAYLFTAGCGTGKSTHTRLWREVFGEQAVMVNDDKPFLKFEGDRVLAYGSPWTGKHGLGENVCFPLKGICILKRGPENVIRRIAAEECMEMLQHQAFEGSEDLVERLAVIVPLWEMECNREREAPLVSHGAMSGSLAFSDDI